MSEPREPAITRALRNAHPTVFSTWAIVAAFSAYFCMYAFRKPFSAATFESLGEPFEGFSMKSLFVIAQVVGYTVGKFYGIKLVSEMSSSRRGVTLVLLIGFAEAALGLFAVTPAPWNAFWLFVNGLPLAMVWGVVFGFLEGRRTTEALGAGLSASYIVASGAVKSVGLMVKDDWGVSETLMPFVVGALFFPAFLLFVWMLTMLPKPSQRDEELRTKREPMDGSARSAFFKAFLPGLLPLVLLHFLLTALRGVRDDFAVEIYAGVGAVTGQVIEKGTLTTTELIVAFGVLVGLGLLMLVKNNRRAVVTVQGLMALGSLLIGLSTLAFDARLIDGPAWMIGVGLGLYLAYVPFGSMLFDRLIAAVGWVGTAGFMIYVTDAVGYLGQATITTIKEITDKPKLPGEVDMTWFEFFRVLSYATSIVCVASFVWGMYYFARRARHRSEHAAT